MITPDYVRMMARYNTWQNDSQMEAACQLGEEDRRKDRGAFFGSIDETLVHILWADRLWLSRFGGCEPPEFKSMADARKPLPWDEFEARRRQMDQEIRDWSDGLSPEDLEGDLSWYSILAQKDFREVKWPLIVHMFNHATHHRGQVHAMLTAAGITPQDTDIPFMPQHYKDL